MQLELLLFLSQCSGNVGWRCTQCSKIFLILFVSSWKFVKNRPTVHQQCQKELRSCPGLHHAGAAVKYILALTMLDISSPVASDFILKIVRIIGLKVSISRESGIAREILGLEELKSSNIWHVLNYSTTTKLLWRDQSSISFSSLQFSNRRQCESSCMSLPPWSIIVSFKSSMKMIIINLDGTHVVTFVSLLSSSTLLIVKLPFHYTSPSASVISRSLWV